LWRDEVGAKNCLKQIGREARGAGTYQNDSPIQVSGKMEEGKWEGRSGCLMGMLGAGTRSQKRICRRVIPVEFQQFVKRTMFISANEAHPERASGETTNSGPPQTVTGKKQVACARKKTTFPPRN